MSDDRYTRTDRNGTPSKTGHFDLFTIYNLKRAEAKLGYSLTVLQGGYNAGGVAASAGTHDGAGAVDLAPYDWARKVKVLRQCGFAAWHRPRNWDGRGGGEHIHAILIGNEKASAGAKSQVAAYKRFRNGLANNAADLSWHPLPIKNAPYAVKPPTSIRPMQFNLPGGDKIGDTAGRIKAGVALAKSATPSFIGWNELVGRKAAGVPSDFATAVDKALGKGWWRIVPTKPLNENYISYDSTKLALIHQYEDTILKAATGGRHLTRVVFQDRKTGFIFAVGQTHLVNGSTAAHERDRQKQAADALAAMKAVSKKHDGCPFIIQGDMNTPHDLTALVKAGMKRTRKWADTSSTRDATTYTNYDKAKPSTNSADWIIDHQYVTDDFYVVGYTVVRKLDKTGNYVKPRPSDHDAVVSSIRTQ